MVDEVSLFISNLLADPDKETIGAEISALWSIYGESSIELWKENGKTTKSIRYQITVRLQDHEAVSVRILVSVPPSYPESSPPQLQLLSKYVGDFQVDSSLFGSILRTFLSSDGVKWVPGQVSVFDGLETVISWCTTWYERQLSENVTAASHRNESLRVKQENYPQENVSQKPMNEVSAMKPDPTSSIPLGVEIHEAAPIQDRKSVFTGRACRISHPSEVRPILNYLISDHRIAKAAHPIINAWRCEMDGVIHADNDDNNETAAGGRLAHLLQILGVNNVLVIVTRYFGGIHLGPDRFKHINQAARDALRVGGFLDNRDSQTDFGSRDRKHVQARNKHGKHGK